MRQRPVLGLRYAKTPIECMLMEPERGVKPNRR
jgi:hypothetical protein